MNGSRKFYLQNRNHYYITNSEKLQVMIMQTPIKNGEVLLTVGQPA
jgi:hypothetical protein